MVLKVNLYSGIVVERDAVSASLRLKFDILEELVARGADIVVNVFTKGTDSDHGAIHVVPSVASLLRDDRFWEADLHVFEFAIHYDLFDSVFVIPPEHPILVIDHNVTPPALVDLPDARRACELGLVQRHNLSCATTIACDSEYNRSVCEDIGLQPDRLSVLHLPANNRSSFPDHTRFRDRDEGPVKLFYLGRLVRSKGVPDLLEAAERVWMSGHDDFELTVAGNTHFSDPIVVEQVRTCIERVGSKKLRLLANPADREVVALLRDSHVLVMPSYHEGLCVPVVEALTADCHVITYDAANLPNVVGSFGTIVPTGDVERLSDAIRMVVRAISRGEGSSEMQRLLGGRDREQFVTDLERHLRSYSPQAYEAGFLRLLLDLGRQAPSGLSPNTVQLVERRLAEVG